MKNMRKVEIIEKILEGITADLTLVLLLILTTFDDDNYVNQELDIVRAGDFREALNNIVAILESQQSIQTQQIARRIKAKEPETFDAIDEFEFFHDWGNFVQALTNAFGAIAPEDDAETALMDLTFGENGQAMSYFILFAKYAARTTFEDRFLRQLPK
ncbi:hypothetical protein Clacol_003399 [Clathrus columnatus]|uniref:Uncharacterized protein n=1 Tax=Clathrus columnatus TaxID=1419009 RepID=A0AAV5A6P4_9AGAM|nr:hypothetical protein Clacol_003399 [Clathrus columnatus]